MVLRVWEYPSIHYIRTLDFGKSWRPRSPLTRPETTCNPYPTSPTLPYSTLSPDQNSVPLHMLSMYVLYSTVVSSTPYTSPYTHSLTLQPARKLHSETRTQPTNQPTTNLVRDSRRGHDTTWQNKTMMIFATLSTQISFPWFRPVDLQGRHRRTLLFCTHFAPEYGLQNNFNYGTVSWERTQSQTLYMMSRRVSDYQFMS